MVTIVFKKVIKKMCEKLFFKKLSTPREIAPGCSKHSKSGPIHVPRAMFRAVSLWRGSRIFFPAPRLELILITLYGVCAFLRKRHRDAAEAAPFSCIVGGAGVFGHSPAL